MKKISRDTIEKFVESLYRDRMPTMLIPTTKRNMIIRRDFFDSPQTVRAEKKLRGISKDVHRNEQPSVVFLWKDLPPEERPYN